MSLDSSAGIDELQEMLDRAARREAESGSKGQLMSFFLHELIERMNASAIRFSQVTPGSAHSLWSAGTTSQFMSEKELPSLVASGQNEGVTHVGEGNFWRCFASAEVVGGVWVVLELIAVTVSQSLLNAATDVLADLHRREMLRKLHLQQSAQNAAVEFIAHLHTKPESHRIAGLIANDAAAVLNCQRISVCSRGRSSNWNLLAVTGVHSPNDRSDAARHLCEKVRETRRTAGQTQAEAAKPTDDGLVVLPLTPDGDWERCTYAMVVEWHPASPPEQSLLNEIRRHAALALENADRAQLHFLSPILKSTRGQQIRLGALFALVAAALLVLVFCQTELQIEAYGVIQPSKRVSIYAQEAGIVTDVSTKDGDDILEGESLFSLKSDELSLQLETTLGDLAAAQARLAALESMRISGESTRSPILMTEQAEVSARIQSLEKQRLLLESRRQYLTVSSPVSGRVFAPEIRERFQGRPVLRGQFLCEVADLSEPWELKLQVGETDIRHVLEAASADDPLPITFHVETRPEHSAQTQLAEISRTIELSDSGQLTTSVYARLESPPDGSDRPGAGVVGYINCGQRSMGYVYFRKLIDVVRRKLLL
ncbi:MAG: efflux RND transporter periplasmic adaptor subunit [Planctomycetaceae bacterium]|nr:efflux RND transporter periplasmic adaptor subunit [Planctomycetaceae bacterium]